MAKILEVKNLKKSYENQNNTQTVLNGIDLDINKGEFVGVMGPSGAGKSTLLNIISTIDTASSGKIEIEGKNITNLDNRQIAKFRRTSLGFIFQDFNLLDTLSVKDNIVLPLALARVNVSEINTKVNSIAGTLGIQDLLNKYPYEISGGQKQRTACARAIITNPSLILADEPTGALDSKSSTDLLNAMTRLNENQDATIMMVTHDAFAASYCKRVLFIKDGLIFKEIIRTGSRKEFFKEILDVLSLIGGGDNGLI
ncbi:ABC transporter ATP-binding protein [Paraclostridium sordellii]|uniref:ABC transporter ATP-binding protein n=1 Tax=Paraclostridium sordellii TaxID=1505 RepID=UPI0005DE5AE4|nr:ABC transporter ATP-binding protein [Paeniclostridium sordellii]CEO13281.1 bacitracin ABC transporter ATP-binding protein [[Clostridium] sordellii] [Paeniclostridium sordellii]CEP89091.1 bacitracin ABC transporter ATP-binding protein [[Clostridium] sordellii] [Paeniclostridium sordellii]CEQ01255.1 bacitracin ABC transporter ATP-binding protein [[Clostridium] sordellii] [Paeniclostridium sordellii]